MSKINTELFIARRLASDKPGRKNVMIRIATLSVAIGMAVMILSLAVIVGFKRDITERLTGFGAHVRVVATEDGSIWRSAKFEEAVRSLDGFASIAPFAERSGIIRTADAIEGVMLKGVSELYDTSFYADHLVDGSMPQLDDTVRHKEILVSRATADLLQLSVGDRVEMMFVGDGQMNVRRDSYKICGIYSSGMDEMDRMMTLTDIRNVQKLEHLGSEQVRGYEINTTDFSHLDDFATDIFNIASNVGLGNSGEVMVETLTRLYPNVFDWLKAHNVNAAVIIVIMLSVALLNIVSAMLIIVLERTSMIGILKALGMKNGSVQKIFLLRSLAIVLRGMLYGNVAGVGLALLQKYTGVVKLNSAGYMLSRVPISLDWSWWLSLNIATPVVITVLLTVPVAVVALIKPEQTIKYQ